MCLKSLDIKKLGSGKKLNLKLLTLKLVMLCMPQRCQSVRLKDISQYMSKGKSSYKFHNDKLVKQSRSGKPQPVVVLSALPTDGKICVIKYLGHWE